jgi:hypothetical protein
MPPPPLASVHPLLEDRLRVARQVPLPRPRLTEAWHQFLIARHCSILEVVLKGLDALERVLQHADQRVRGLLHAGGLRRRRGSAWWAAPRHRRDGSVAPAAPGAWKRTAPV